MWPNRRSSWVKRQKLPQKLVRKLGQKLATAQAAPPAVLRVRRGPQGGQGDLLR